MEIKKKPRPKVTHGPTIRMETGCGHLYVTVNRDNDDELFEVFAHLGKTGGCAACQCEALTRQISIGIRCGVPVEEQIKQLLGIRCPGISGGSENPETYQMSCPEAIGQAILKEGGEHEEWLKKKG